MAGFERYELLLARLGKFKFGNSCLYIKRLADIDEPVLRELIAASVEYMRQAYAATERRAVTRSGRRVNVAAASPLRHSIKSSAPDRERQLAEAVRAGRLRG